MLQAMSPSHIMQKWQKKKERKKERKKKDGGGAIFCHFRALSLWLPFKFSFTSQGLWKLYTSYNMQSVSMCLVPERRAELRS